MPRLALVTYAAAPDLTPDDRLLRSALEAAGAVVTPIVWSELDPGHEFDLVVLRSTWDYFLRPDEFAGWLARMEDSGAEVVNPPDVVRWNGDKRYLLDLERMGVEIVPTVLIDGGDRSAGSLGELLEARGWSDAVVKPAVSGGAYLTWRTTAGSADEARYREVLDSPTAGGALVQPFMPEVVNDGELSLIFFDGVFSHAAVKRPKAGDFRVQQEHGGRYSPVHPSEEVIAQAGQVIVAAAAFNGLVPADLAYARVDGIVRRRAEGEAFVLMELECIEPSLFFLQHPPAAERMAAALLSRLQSRTTASLAGVESRKAG